MKLLQHLFGIVSLSIALLMTSCSTDSDVIAEDSDFTTSQDLCIMYYEQAKNLFHSSHMATRGVVVDESEFQRYSALGQKFSNITMLSETKLSKTVNETAYKKLVSSYENSLGTEIFEFVTIQEYRQTCQLLEQYLLKGGHSKMKLMSFIPKPPKAKT